MNQSTNIGLKLNPFTNLCIQRKQVKLGGGWQARGYKTLVRERMGFCLLTEPSFPASGNRFGSCSLLGIRSYSAAVVELSWPLGA